MVRKIQWIIALCLLIGSCNQKTAKNPETQQTELDKMNVDASILFTNAENKSGKEYLELMDEYYALKYKWVKTAIAYSEKFSMENKTEDEIRRMSYIAGIAGKEQQVIDIIKEDFRLFPESKTVEELVLTYFENAYLLEPAAAGKYVNFGMFKPADELYCYAMLAVGFSGWGDTGQAAIYYEKTNKLLAEILADPNGKYTIPVLYVAGLRSFIACSTGNREEAYNILAGAEKEFTAGQEQYQIGMFRNRINILGNAAPDLETGHWIGTQKPLSIAALKGKVLLLAFFTWDCEPCNVNVPYLSRLQEQVNNSDFMLIGVTNYTGRYGKEQDISNTAEYEYMKNHYYIKRKIRWPVSMSKTGMDNYGIYAAPAYVLIDKAGNVNTGYFISNFTYLKRKIELLLAEHP